MQWEVCLNAPGEDSFILMTCGISHSGLGVNHHILFYCSFETVMQFILLYLDPGSGSYLVQVIIAAVLGVSFFFKNFWLKVKAFFFRPGKKTGEKEAEN